MASGLRTKPSKRACAEALLLHLSYSQEKMEEILGKFKKVKENDQEKDDNDDALFEEDEILGVDTVCEAKLLGRLLHKLEREEEKGACPTEEARRARSTPARASNDAPASADGARPNGSQAVAAWPEAERGLGDKPDVSQEKLPDSCRLALHCPLNASAFLQGFLPAGQTWRGQRSLSRAYKADGATGGIQGRATRSYSAALAEVLAFLWSWQDARASEKEHAVAESAAEAATEASSASAAEGAGPKRRRRN